METLADELDSLGDSALRPTRRVVLRGLLSRKDLNGLEAVILPGKPKGSSPDLRLPVCTTLGNEKMLARLQNLTAAASITAILGQDDVFAFFFHFDPATALTGRRVCQSWRLQLSQLLAGREWQAAHLPLPALCRSASWDAAELRLVRRPGEARSSCADWVDMAQAEARTGIPSCGLRRYPKSLEQLLDVETVEGNAARPRLPWRRIRPLRLRHLPLDPLLPVCFCLAGSGDEADRIGLIEVDLR